MASKQTVVINKTLDETRVAFVEDGTPTEFHLERDHDRGVAGNIYRGKVVRVLPGMQAAFVDIGLERAAFLYVSDIYPEFLDMDFGEEEDDESPAKESAAASHASGDDADGDFDDEDDAKPASRKSEGAGGPRRGPWGRRRDRGPRPKIEDLVQAGQEIVVQVVKGPIGTKGARITSHVTIPGRYLVLMPTIDRLGVSRRVADFRGRRRFRSLLDPQRPEGMGFIVRTAASKATDVELLRDMEFLIEVWRDITRMDQKAPQLLHRDLDLPLRMMRDMIDEKVERILVDDRETAERLQNFSDLVMPSTNIKIENYNGDRPLFDQYGIEPEVEKIFHKKVWLKSGGYLIMDQTEALCAIDVNTGRYVGKTDLEETILKTNLEAAKEIVNQLRLRAIGGIIIIDFIDMERIQNREKVFRALQEELYRDRARAQALKMSDLGLVEMTRKRTGESLSVVLSETCQHCDGRGYNKSKETVIYEIFRDVIRKARRRPSKTFYVEVHPTVADVLYSDQRRGVEEIEREHDVRLIVRASTHRAVDSFEVAQ